MPHFPSPRFRSQMGNLLDKPKVISRLTSKRKDCNEMNPEEKESQDCKTHQSGVRTASDFSSTVLSLCFHLIKNILDCCYQVMEQQCSLFVGEHWKIFGYNLNYNEHMIM